MSVVPVVVVALVVTVVVIVAVITVITVVVGTDVGRVTKRTRVLTLGGPNGFALRGSVRVFLVVVVDDDVIVAVVNAVVAEVVVVIVVTGQPRGGDFVTHIEQMCEDIRIPLDIFFASIFIVIVVIVNECTVTLLAHIIVIVIVIDVDVEDVVVAVAGVISTACEGKYGRGVRVYIWVRE